MQMKRLQGIIGQTAQGLVGITLPAMGFHNDNTRLCPLVLRVEVYHISHAYHLMLVVLNDQPHLTIGIDIVATGSNIIVQRIATIRHIGSTHMPEAAIILYLIENVEVFGFYSANIHILLSSLDLLGLTKRFSWSNIISIRASEARK